VKSAKLTTTNPLYNKENPFISIAYAINQFEALRKTQGRFKAIIIEINLSNP